MQWKTAAAAIAPKWVAQLSGDDLQLQPAGDAAKETYFRAATGNLEVATAVSTTSQPCLGCSPLDAMVFMELQAQLPRASCNQGFAVRCVIWDLRKLCFRYAQCRFKPLLSAQPPSMQPRWVHLHAFEGNKACHTVALSMLHPLCQHDFLEMLFMHLAGSSNQSECHHSRCLRTRNHQ